ncbi:hypothetical protein ABZ957_17560 [Streptomyces sp. NPDC046316]|uniref:hypothetical protein n=1 Tax=Streptomyces sp. NPDC046316 TaxID=3154494 RepID=UPI003400B9EA
MTREPDALAAALSAALRREQGGADAGEARAREAFRAARAAEETAARRTRRRDDWRPAPVRGRWHVSLRTTAFGVAATVLLGGVAVAASGTLDPAPPAPPRPAPARETPETPATLEAPATDRGAPAAPTSVGEAAGRTWSEGADKTRGASQGKGNGRDKGAPHGKDQGRAKSKSPSTSKGSDENKGERAAENRVRGLGVNSPAPKGRNP